MRVRLESVGCRLNIGEIETMAREFAAAGHRIVGAGEPAEVCIFNSCTVTGVASRKSRHILRQLRRAFPDASLVATGCLAELAPDEVRRLGVDLVVGNQDKDHLPRLLSEAGLLPDTGPYSSVSSVGPADGPGDRTRAFLKVQDGCDNRCTFCVVTIARGAGRSRSPDEVVDEVRDLHDHGYQEVVLSGVHLGSYGHDLGDPRGLEELVRRIMSETGMPRIRLSSLEPWDLHEAFFELMSESRVLPHLHLPLQSGCDATLRRMARKTDPARFARLVDSARAAAPDLSISTDIIVGFPGETDQEFEQSIAFVEEIGFSRLHVFRYSRRDGTRAADMPHQVPGPLVQERSRRMHLLGMRLESAFNSRFVGSSMPVLWERSDEFGDGCRWSGLTHNYIRTVTETCRDVDLFNRVTDTTILSTLPSGVLGRVDGVSVASLIEPAPRRQLPIVEK
jgi:threonylcarbamoyladenosine tRNA methylthiotransferase MtaB